MKKIYLFTFLVISIGLFIETGCTKKFLEKPKGGDVTVDTIFHTQKQAQYAVARMYQLCIKGYLPKDYYQCRPEADVTDEVYIIHPTYDWGALGVHGGPYITGSMTPDETGDYAFSIPGPGTAFNDHYAGIRQANLVLKNIHLVQDASDAWKKDVTGQALFCRAMQHYELFRYYGGIPIVSKVLNGEDKLSIHRSSVKTVVDSIVNWCDQAATLLPPTRPAQDYGKITKLAALALKARVLLYAASPLYNTPPDMQSKVAGARYGDARDSVLCYPDYDVNRWKLAADAAKAVIDNAPAAGVFLYDTNQPKDINNGLTYADLGDYSSVWNVYANKELILVNTANQIPAGGAGAFGWGRYMSSKLRLAQWGVKNNVPLEFLEKYQTVDGKDWTMPETGQDLPTFFQKNIQLDPRFYQTIAYDGMYYNSSRGQLKYYLAGDGYDAGTLSSSDAGPDGYALEPYKYVARIDNMSDAHFAWIIFRLGEFYLDYAEALNEFQGPSGDPTTYLNLIRDRAGMPDEHFTSPDAFRKAVHRERTIELAYEGQRYNDLMRWLTADSVLNQTLHGIQTMAKDVGGKLKRSWKIVTFINRTFPKKYYYLPFPYAEVSKNYLGDGQGWNGQNPGW